MYWLLASWPLVGLLFYLFYYWAEDEYTQKYLRQNRETAFFFMLLGWIIAVMLMVGWLEYFISKVKHGRRRKREVRNRQKQMMKEKAAAKVAERRAAKGATKEMPTVVENIAESVFVFKRLADTVLNTKVIDPNLPVRTRDGRRAWLREIDSRKSWPITALVANPGTSTAEINTIHMADGKFLTQAQPAGMDLFNVDLETWRNGDISNVNSKTAHPG